MKPSYQIYDTEISRKISFQKVQLDKDVSLLHQWMKQEHVIPFWNLNIPFEHFRQHIKQSLVDQHQTLYLGLLDDKPISYWETYWVKGDVVEKTYEQEPFDQGIHLLIGETEFVGKGFALPLLRAMVRFQFDCLQTKKVIAEPDIRNKKMIHVFETCGFTSIKPIQLPDKTGLLMFCERENFEKRWSNDSIHQQV